MPLTHRQRFVEHALQHRGAVVVWGGLDCSELVALALKAAGGKDTTKTHRARTFAAETRRLDPKAELPIAGDLAMYGPSWDDVIHVAIHLNAETVLSADGATESQQDEGVAALNLKARVREHSTPGFRGDYLGSCRNTLVDVLDKVTR